MFNLSSRYLNTFKNLQWANCLYEVVKLIKSFQEKKLQSMKVISYLKSSLLV